MDIYSESVAAHVHSYRISLQPPRVRALDGCDLRARATCGLREEHTHTFFQYPSRGCFLCAARYTNSQNKGRELGALTDIEPAVINC
jgi:hypothetical protein